VLPPQAIGQDREGRFVFVVRPQSDGVGIIERRPVSIGGLIPSERFGSGLEVLEGLTDGDKVVTAGVSKITDGQQVKLAAEWKG
jgi:multidrug efflux pump subunit AcrA (membrane-fusion protein)